MGDINKLINWFKAREGRVTYSMSYRNGPNSYDCSSSVYYALIAAGFLPSSTGIGNTESLYRLEGNLFQPISRSEVKRGDIFVSGTKGASGGSNGHTGVFLDNQTIIHCTYAPGYGVNGITTTPAQGWMGGPPNYYYRLKGVTSGNTNNSTNQNTNKPDNEEEQEMFLFYKIKGSDAIYFFNGMTMTITSLNHGDEKNALNDVYKACNGGRDIPYREYDSKKDPWYARLQDVCTRTWQQNDVVKGSIKHK